jgi:hypothetical protein
MHTYTHTHTHTWKFWILIPSFERPHYNICVIWSFEAIFLTTCKSVGCIQIRRNLPSRSQEGKLVDRQSVPQTGRPRQLVYQERSPFEYKWRLEVKTVIIMFYRQLLFEIQHSDVPYLCLCSPVHRDPEFTRDVAMRFTEISGMRILRENT